jgi:hypothetical protein
VSPEFVQPFASPLGMALRPWPAFAAASMPGLPGSKDNGLRPRAAGQTAHRVHLQQPEDVGLVDGLENGIWIKRPIAVSVCLY